MALGQYILDAEGRPVPEPDFLKWSMWMYSHNSEGKDSRIVKHTNIGKVLVSTVFLGLNSSPRRLLLWETMIFAGEHDGYQRRYESRKKRSPDTGQLSEW